MAIYGWESLLKLHLIFYWKLLRFVIWSAEDIKKDGLIFQVWGSAIATPTPPVFRVVLYHTVASGQTHLRGSVCLYIGCPILFYFVYLSLHFQLLQVSKIGVTVSYVPHGVTRKAFDKVLEAFPAPGQIIREDWWKKPCWTLWYFLQNLLSHQKTYICDMYVK